MMDGNVRKRNQTSLEAWARPSTALLGQAVGVAASHAFLPPLSVLHQKLQDMVLYQEPPKPHPTPSHW